MKATLTATGRFEDFHGVRCRIWTGTTDAGTKIEMMVPCVRAAAGIPQADLERELAEIKAERQLVSFDTRLL